VSNIRAIRIRWHAGHPPKPLGCRWCGHPPYDHDASSLPHRRAHQWEQPTSAQFSARMTCRRRLGLQAPYPTGPVRPAAVRPAAAHRPLGPSRLAEGTTYGRGRAPDTPATVHRRPLSVARRGAGA
jgi:hypothetical protein